MLELIPVHDQHDGAGLDEPAKSAIEATVAYYRLIGFCPPWISYLAKADDRCVGICSFKGAPRDNRVEIAYFTFPEHEGKGYATGMCAALVELALSENQGVVITARTLPQENASTRVLRKNRFTCRGVVSDPEDGDVWEWVRTSAETEGKDENQ